MSEELGHKRQRVSKACEQCRKKKIKCDGIQPVCGNCTSLGLTCTYKETTKKRGPPKGYIEAIEGRLHRLEALLNSTIQEDDPRSQAILAELNAPLETAYGELVRPHRSSETGESPIMDISVTMPKEKSAASSKHDHHHNAGSSSNDGSRQSTPPTISKTDANDNLGNLSIDEGGQLRYYGKSSGFYMLRNSKNFQNGAIHFNKKTSDSTSTSPAAAVTTDPYELPPQDLSNHLLDLYFTHFYPLLPLLHKKSFLANLDKQPPLLLNAIYAVASRISPDVRVRSDPASKETAGDIFLERARILLDFEWDDFRVSTVQSLLLLSSHQNGALKNIRGWLYSGLAFRMCQNLGLNRNCEHWNLTDQEKEERKRVFYCCFVVDRLSCAMHGRAPMIDSRDMDAPYPKEIDPDDQDNKPNIMDNFHQLIKLCEILGDILTQLYMVEGRKQVSQLSSPDSVISKLDRALNKWMSKLPPCVQYRPPNTRLNEKSPAPKLELCQIHMLFYTTLILLHRPFIPGPNQTSTSSVFPSASICTFAANKILDIVECLMAEERLKNVNNYALYFMFTAGIIFINDALSSDEMFAFEAKISINKIIRAMDEVQHTWITSQRQSNILGELAGLRDINLENIDERAVQQHKNSNEQKDMSIAVPNSPIEEDDEDNGQHQQQQQQHNPAFDILVDEREQHKQFPVYLTQYVNNMPVDFKQDASPHLDSSFTTSTPTTNNMAPTNYNNSMASSSPAVMNNNNYQQQQQQQGQEFDPLGTAFWGVPMSFDIDEWNSYFSNQNFERSSNSSPQHPQQQHQQAQQPIFGMTQPQFSNTLGAVAQSQQQQQQQWQQQG